MRYSLGRDAALHVLGGVGLPHVVALQIAEQPHRIAAEAWVVAQPRLPHVPREVDRRQPVDRRGSGSPGRASGTWQPAQPSSWNCWRPRWKSCAKLVVVGGSERPGGRGELAVLDQRLDDRHLEQRQVRRHRRERSAAELVAHAVAVGIALDRRRPPRRLRRHGEHVALEEHIALDAHVDLQRLGGEVGERRRACPSSRTASRRGPRRRRGAPDVSTSPARRDAQHAEVDALWRPAYLRVRRRRARRRAPGRRVAAAGRGSSRAPAPARRRARPARADSARRRSPCARRRRSRNAVSVSAPAPFGPPTQWHDGHEMVSGPPKTPSCTRRNGPVVASSRHCRRRARRRSRTRARRAAARGPRARRGRPRPAATRAGSRAARISRRKEPGAAASRSRSSCRRAASALRVARRLQAERRRPLERRAVRAPRGASRSCAPSACDERQAEHRQARQVFRRGRLMARTASARATATRGRRGRWRARCSSSAR